MRILESSRYIDYPTSSYPPFPLQVWHRLPQRAGSLKVKILPFFALEHGLPLNVEGGVVSKLGLPY